MTDWEWVLRAISMARQRCIEYAGAIYHVMACGDRRENIYHTDEDRKLFLETLGERTN